MENKLKKLMDFQRFEKNQKLDEMILETERKYGTALSDEDLEIVSAAGPEQSQSGSEKIRITKEKSLTDQ